MTLRSNSRDVDQHLSLHSRANFEETYFYRFIILSLALSFFFSRGLMTRGLSAFLHFLMKLFVLAAVALLYEIIIFSIF